MKNIIIILISGCFVFLACQSQEHQQKISEQKASNIAITQWTDKMEIFMEHETAVAGQEIKFIIHLTNLADFQPIREGKVTLDFERNGSVVSIEKDTLLREGIFTPVKTFETAGDYNFSIGYQGSKVNESFRIGTFRVYPTFDDIPFTKDEDAEEIIYLKEQQWKTAFATEEAGFRAMKSFVDAVGEVKPRPAYYADIVSPVEGIMSTASAVELAKPGQKIRKGQTMAVIVPPFAAENSWAKIYLDYEQAKADYERAQRLKERNAVSDRDFEQARRNHEMNKAGLSHYFAEDEGGLRFDSENNQFLIIAPLSGVVSDVQIMPGQKVDSNQKLFTIVNPDIVWLKIELFADQAAKLSDIFGASISIPGSDKKIKLDEKSISLISRGEIIDPRKHTIALWLEAKNYKRKFMIGQTFNAQIYTGQEKNMLSVPVSAVFNENSKEIVFVHTTGESFEKREVQTDRTYHDYIAIIKGLQTGERVVSDGGYQVKLASNSEEIGHPHTH